MEAHTPHEPPEDFRRIKERVNFRIGDAFANDIEQPDRNRIAYDDSVVYLSSIYRELFTTLKQSFNYIITLSDHGELLGEHGMWNHGYGLYPQLIHVPLVVSGSGIQDKIREDIVSLLDIPSTVANLTDVDFRGRGEDILAGVSEASYLVEYHGFLPMHRKQFERKAIAEQFDYYNTPLQGMVTQDGSYIYQTHDDGIRVYGGGVDNPQERLQRLKAEIPIRDVEDENPDVSEDVRSRLRELGYA
jgi:arylsulfatase